MYREREKGIKKKKKEAGKGNMYVRGVNEMDL
jgi:hypothetical protein